MGKVFIGDCGSDMVEKVINRILERGNQTSADMYVFNCGELCCFHEGSRTYAYDRESVGHVLKTLVMLGLCSQKDWMRQEYLITKAKRKQLALLFQNCP